jgi:hypothetical protein
MMIKTITHDRRARISLLAACALMMTMGAARAAYIYVGHRTCSEQLDNCIAFRRMRGPFLSEGLCTVAFHRCMKTGVWDGTTIFPYGGARITGMIRR